MKYLTSFSINHISLSIRSLFLLFFTFCTVLVYGQKPSYPGVAQSGIYRVDVTNADSTWRTAVFKNSCPKYSLGFQNMESKDQAPLNLFAGRSINWAKFTLDGSVTISVTVTNTTKVPVSGNTVKIYPSRHGVTSTTSGNTITFTLTEPGQYSVEIGDEGYKNGLILFADPPEVDIPSKTNPDFLVLNNASTSDVANISSSYTGLYFTQGIHDIGAFTIPSHIKNVRLLDKK